MLTQAQATGSSRPIKHKLPETRSAEHDSSPAGNADGATPRVLRGQFELQALLVDSAAVLVCRSPSGQLEFRSPLVTDDQFLAAFENCRIRGEHFHHADHVRMGFLYLCRFPAPEALRRFSDGLMNFAAANGKAALYHETITWAFLLLIRERVARWCQQNERQPSWDDFAGDNLDLLNWKNNILRKYYRDETLASEFAKRTFV